VLIKFNILYMTILTMLRIVLVQNTIYILYTYYHFFDLMSSKQIDKITFFFFFLISIYKITINYHIA